MEHPAPTVHWATPGADPVMPDVWHPPAIGSPVRYRRHLRGLGPVAVTLTDAAATGNIVGMVRPEVLRGNVHRIIVRHDLAVLQVPVGLVDPRGDAGAGLLAGRTFAYAVAALDELEVDPEAQA